MSETSPTPSNQPAPPSHAELKEFIIDALRNVYDPEIPVNIYDLGLVYDIEIAEDYRVHVVMTLTSPGCPVAQTFPDTVAAHVKSVPGVADCTVEVTWDPPWSQDLLSETARLQLGLF